MVILILAQKNFLLNSFISSYSSDSKNSNFTFNANKKHKNND